MRVPKCVHKCQDPLTWNLCFLPSTNHSDPLTSCQCQSQVKCAFYWWHCGSNNIVMIFCFRKWCPHAASVSLWCFAVCFIWTIQESELLKLSQFNRLNWTTSISFALNCFCQGFFSVLHNVAMMSLLALSSKTKPLFENFKVVVLCM